MTRGKFRRQPPRSPSQGALDQHPTGRDVLPGEKCILPPPTPATRPVPPTRDTARALRRGRRPGTSEKQPLRGRSSGTGLSLPLRPFGSLPFTPERFHVLLNSLFKVLFNFPSRYLFAIGLVVIFSLRWSLPPTWCSTLKEHDSEESSSRQSAAVSTGLAPSAGCGPVQGRLGLAGCHRDDGTSRTRHLPAR